MTAHQVLHNELATVNYHTVEGYIHHTFHKPVTGEPFRTIMNTALDYLIQQKGTKWLSDDRKNAQFAPEDITFALGDWGPRAAAGGWKYWALVVPEDIAGRAGMRDIVEVFFNMGVRVGIFTEVEAARTWLLQV
ncbi:MAG: hypothetical protein JNL42_13495 [Anaerolineae bacterium]|nr:hypothetical protein [Anaerolineae bacterium]